MATHPYVRIYPNQVVAPTVSNDSTQGYEQGDIWIDVVGNKTYQCVLPTAGAAVWIDLASSGGYTQEQIEDFVGAMVSGNTETRISVTYDDATAKLNFAVDSIPVEVLASAESTTLDSTDTVPMLNGITLKYITGDNLASELLAAMRPDLDDSYVSPPEVRGFIRGLKLVWVSATALTVTSGRAYITSSGSILATAGDIAKTGLSLSSSTWYHVYLYNNSGSTDIEIVTTAPLATDDGIYYKTGDTSRRYIGSVRTDGSGNLYNFVHHLDSNAIVYQKHNSTSSPFRVLSGGTASSATAVSLAAVVPITAPLAMVRIVSSANQVLRLSEDNSVGASQNTQVLSPSPAPGTSSLVVTADMGMDSSQQIWYAFGAAVGSGAGYIDVTGYKFER